MNKIDWSLLLGAFLAAASGIAWAAKAGSRADLAWDLASKDHDAITRLEVILPRLERAIERLENRP